MSQKKLQKAPIIPALIALAICAVLGISNKGDISKIMTAVTEVSTTQTTTRSDSSVEDFSSLNVPPYSPKIKESFSGIVTKVYDGDTLHVLSNGVDRKIRLFGIDAPETTQKYGIDSRDYARKLVDGKNVLVRVCDIDRYERYVAWIQTGDGTILNFELVKAGYAWYYEAYAKDNKALLGLQSEAKANRCGLWADKSPMKPWEYRKLEKGK